VPVSRSSEFNSSGGANGSGAAHHIEDQVRFDVRHFGPSADGRQNEFAQGITVFHAHMHQKVIGATDVVGREDLRQRTTVMLESLHHITRVSRQANRHECLQANAHGPGRHFGMVAAQHAAFLQAAHPRQCARLGEPHARGELLVAQPRILLQQGDERAIYAVEGRSIGLIPQLLRHDFLWSKIMPNIQL